MSKTQIKSLKLRIRALEEELQTCETAAQDASVRASLDDAWRQIAQLCGHDEYQTPGRWPWHEMPGMH